MSDFGNGQQVTWDMGNGTARGTVADRFNRKVARRIRDRIVTRYGSPENPAYLIKQEDGSEVLMFGSELNSDQ
jgi:hypothetical protein